MAKSKSHSDKIKSGGILAGAIFLLGLAVLAGLWMEQNTRITGVEFSGYYFTAAEELEAAIESPVGMLADSVDLGSIYSSVSALSYVKDLNISMASRGKLSVTVREREPIGLLINGRNQAFVDKDGVKLPVQLKKDTDVPLVYGFSTDMADTLSGTAFGQVRDFLLAAKKRPFSWVTISEVTWNEREGVVALSSENGVKLVFGNEDYDKKLNHWEAFYQQVASRKGIRSYRSLDLRFRNQIVADKI